VQARLLELTVKDVKAGNQAFPQEEILEAIEEAVANS
jgi:hypothetical protein